MPRIKGAYVYLGSKVFIVKGNENHEHGYRSLGANFITSCRLLTISMQGL